jgi:hypothetical protein
MPQPSCCHAQRAQQAASSFMVCIHHLQGVAVCPGMQVSYTSAAPCSQPSAAASCSRRACAGLGHVICCGAVPPPRTGMRHITMHWTRIRWQRDCRNRWPSLGRCGCLLHSLPATSCVVGLPFQRLNLKGRVKAIPVRRDCSQGLT